MTAARMALLGMVPNVYKEWVASQGRITALYRQNRNGDEVVAKDLAEIG